MKKKKTVVEEVIPEEIMQTVQPVKKNGIIFLSVILAVMILLLAIAVAPFYSNAKKAGEDIGNKIGWATGKALGSYDGITSGLSEGYNDGKTQGLRAEDTETKIANEMTSIGKLDVLKAESQFVDNFREGNDYKALFVYKTQAAFSVNLENADISVNEDDLTLILPEPECEFSIDEDESEKLADWQKFFWSGSAEAGYIGYMNSMEQIKKRAASEMSNYDALMELAKKSAKKQVQMLADAITLPNPDTGNKYRINVVFDGEEYGNE